jgi:hypothetical protein
LHRNSLARIATNNSVSDTFGAHCRWAFPFLDILGLRDIREEEWPERFIGTVVYGLFPSCVLVQSPGSGQMIRVYPGSEPGLCTVYLTHGHEGPIVSDEQRQQCDSIMNAACAILRDEDFPAAETCQRGAEHALEHVIIGRSEPLVQHFHRAWDDAVNDSLASVMLSELMQTRVNS